MHPGTGHRGAAPQGEFVERLAGRGHHRPGVPAGSHPHADRLGNPAVWHVHTEPDADASGDAIVPAGSLLARWQDAPDAAGRRRLARRIEALLRAGPPEAATMERCRTT